MGLPYYLASLPPVPYDRLVAPSLPTDTSPARLAALTDDEVAEWQPAERARLRWLLEARVKQLTPSPTAGPRGDNLPPARADDLWLYWLILTGRGWGKTRTGAEDAFDFGRRYGGIRQALVAPTFTDARDTCVEGDSGLLTVCPPECLRDWNRSLGEFTLWNGSYYKLFSAEKPARLRGPQHHRAWCDELAAWQYLQDTWDMLMFGLRLRVKMPDGRLDPDAPPPQVVITTTPKPRPLIRRLRGDHRTVVTTGSTYENAANLAPEAVDELRRRYANTRLGAQELEGLILEEQEGALWSREVLEASRVRPEDVPEGRIGRTVVAMDPSVTSGEDAAEAGCVVAALTRGGCPICGTREDHGLVLDDRSKQTSPDRWARIAVQAYRDWGADRIIAEVNNGGEMIGLLLRTVDPTVSYKSVNATRGKRTRAEPVSALYEQKRVHHVGFFDELELQMCTWVPDEGASPDRMDACVWGLTELMLGSGFVPLNLGPSGGTQASYWRGR